MNVGDQTRLDDVRTAHQRALMAIREAVVAEDVHSRRAVTADRYLQLLGVALRDRDIFFTKTCNAYHNEMLAAWTALFTPIPVAPASPPSVKARALALATLVFALYGAVHLLNTLVRSFL